MLKSYASSSGSDALLNRQVVMPLNPLHHVGSQNSMVDNAQYQQSDTIQALRTGTSNLTIEDFLHRSEFSSDGPRVLPTSTDHLCPSPQSTSRDQVHIHDIDRMREETNDTPVPMQELLYQKLNSENEKSSHQYDLIKTGAATVKESPLRRPGSQSFPRASASPQQRSLSQQLSPTSETITPYAEFLHNQSSQRQRSSPGLQPNPYEQSMPSLRMDAARRTPPHPPVHRNMSLGAIDEATLSHNHQSINEGDTPLQPWYSGDSDAGSVTYRTNTDITPYMSTMGSQMATPYSQPCTTDSSQSSIPNDITKVEV